MTGENQANPGSGIEAASEAGQEALDLTTKLTQIGGDLGAQRRVNRPRQDIGHAAQAYARHGEFGIGGHCHDGH